MIIPMIIGKMKMLTSKSINLLYGTPGAKNWQRDYHDHVVRGAGEYGRIDWYIRQNVARWGTDRLRKGN